MASATGEEVSPDVIRAYNSYTDQRLLQIRHAGISDQRVALIDDILSRRNAGADQIQATTQGASSYAEQRGVNEVRRPASIPTGPSGGTYGRSTYQSSPTQQTTESYVRSQQGQTTVLSRSVTPVQQPQGTPQQTSQLSPQQAVELQRTGKPIQSQQNLPPRTQQAVSGYAQVQPSPLRRNNLPVQVALNRNVSVSPSIGKAVSFLFNPDKAVVFPSVKISKKLTGYPRDIITSPVKLSDVQTAYANQIFPALFNLNRIATVPFFPKSQNQNTINQFKSKVIAEFIPTTYGGAGLFILGTIAYESLPTFARIGASAFFGYEGIKNTLDVTQPVEKRTASAIVGALGVSGVVFESTPFVRGAIYKFNPNFRPVEEAPQGFKTIKTPEIDTETGLIPKGYPEKTGETSGVGLPSRSPLVRGGFHRQSGGESIFLGPEQNLATSQRGLFSEGKDIQLEKEFFVTPQEPFLKIAETRVSRLGLTDFFSVPKQSEYGVGFGEKPQIGIVKAGVSRTESLTNFRLGTGTELEAIKSFGTIRNVKRFGVTVIQGQGVELYSFSIGRARKISLSNLYSTTEGTQTISSEGLFSTISPSRKIRSKSINISSPISSGTIKFSTGTTRRTGSTRASTRFTFSPSVPTSTIISTPLSTTISTPRSPSKSFPFSPSRGSSIQIPSITQKSKGSPSRKISTTRTPSKGFFSGFNVFVRREKRFRQVGRNLPYGIAFGLGESITQKGLSQSFKVRSIFGGGTPAFKVPKGYYGKNEKNNGIVFIELPKTKINTASEKNLLSFARLIKGGRK